MKPMSCTRKNIFSFNICPSTIIIVAVLIKMTLFISFFKIEKLQIEKIEIIENFVEISLLFFFNKLYPPNSYLYLNSITPRVEYSVWLCSIYQQSSSQLSVLFADC